MHIVVLDYGLEPSVHIYHFSSAQWQEFKDQEQAGETFDNFDDDDFAELFLAKKGFTFGAMEYLTSTEAIPVIEHSNFNFNEPEGTEMA